MPGFADLHMHTYYSDGTSSPQEVVADAVKAELACIAITDHDVADGVAPAIEAGKAVGIEVVPGIELSSEFEGKDIHILGYFIDYSKGPLFDKLEVFLDGRVARMKQMLVNLKAVGIDNIEFEEVTALTKSRAVGRAHLAFLLVQKGWVGSFRAAFDQYLIEGRPGWAPKFQQTPFEAIDLIRQSGGVAVMAHPMLTQKDELISPMVKAGLGGLEVYYSGSTELVTKFYEKIAKKYDLVMTGGSDAHGTVKPYTYVGKMKVPYEAVTLMRTRCGL